MYISGACGLQKCRSYSCGHQQCGLDVVVKMLFSALLEVIRMLYACMGTHTYLPSPQPHPRHTCSCMHINWGGLQVGLPPSHDSPMYTNRQIDKREEQFCPVEGVLGIFLGQNAPN